MKKIPTTPILACAVSLLLTGCATIFSGTTQNINIKAVDVKTSQEVDDIICKVTDGDGMEYPVLSNPGSVHVKRGPGALVVNCKKEGYKQLNISVGDSFNAVTLVNVLFWPGLIVDGLSGAYKKYPSHYVVSMEKVAAPTE
jgi:hypothetical protein